MVRLLTLSLMVLGVAIGASCRGQDAATADVATDPQEMTIGSVAPPIEIEHWMSTGNGRSEPFTEFEPGKVYVVEFWATWCGPCIGSMPHLVDLQQRYADEGVTIVSISDEPLETVERFLERPVRGDAAIAVASELMAALRASDDKVDDSSAAEDAGEESDEADDEEPAVPTYADLTSAYCLTTDPDASVKQAYFRAAGQRGIPCAFVVGKTGVVEWIGHPMAMDDTLAQVLNDSWDREAFGKEFRAQKEFETLMNSAVAAARAGKYDELESALTQLRGFDASPKLTAQAKTMAGRIEGLALMTMFVKDADRAMEELPKQVQKLNGNAEQINALTWQLVQLAERGQKVEPQLLQLAAEQTKGALNPDAPQATLLDTIAHLHYHAGDVEKAIEYQRRSVAQASEENQKAAIEGFLEKLLAEQQAAEEAEPNPDSE